MHDFDNEKEEKKNNGRNRITKSRKHQNTCVAYCPLTEPDVPAV